MSTQENHIPSLRRLVVVGAGAIGGAIGGLVARTGLPVNLIARGEHGEVLRRDGLALRMVNGSEQLRLPCVQNIASHDWSEGDVALISTKLNDARQVLDEILEVAGPGLPVVCALNGLHGEAWAVERFETVLSTLVWMPSTHLVPGEVRLHSTGGFGVLDTGPARGDSELLLSESFCALLRKAGFDAIARADIARWKMGKLLTNIGNTAQALVSDDWRSVAAAAREEAERVLQESGTPHVSRQELLARVSVIGVGEVDGLARGGGSTWQSRVRGKQLESPWLEGALVELAKEAGLSAPVNERLAEAGASGRACRAAELLL